MCRWGPLPEWAVSTIKYQLPFDFGRAWNIVIIWWYESMLKSNIFRSENNNNSNAAMRCIQRAILLRTRTYHNNDTRSVDKPKHSVAYPNRISPYQMTAMDNWPNELLERWREIICHAGDELIIGLDLLRINYWRSRYLIGSLVFLFFPLWPRIDWMGWQEFSLRLSLDSWCPTIIRGQRMRKRWKMRFWSRQ